SPILRQSFCSITFTARYAEFSRTSTSTTSQLRHFDSEHARNPFLHDHDFFFDPVALDSSTQTLQGFLKGFETQPKRSVMHRNHDLCIQLSKGLDRLLRIHVYFPSRRRVIRSNRQQSDLCRQTLADLREPGKISAIPAVKNRSRAKVQVISTKATVKIVENTGAPMMTRC